jgi:hypothetical protein
MSQSHSDAISVDPKLFPNIDLTARSSRSGYSGLRYAPIRSDRGDGSYNLGDIDTGRMVFPTGQVSRWQPEDILYENNLQQQAVSAKQSVVG